MLGAAVNFELFVHVGSQGVLGQHAFDSHFDNPFGVAFKHRFKGNDLLAAGVTAVTLIFLGVSFVAREPDFVGIDDDDKVAGVNVRGIGGFVLAHQGHRGLDSQAAQNGPVGVDYVPVTLDSFFFLDKTLHFVVPVQKL